MYIKKEINKNIYDFYLKKKEINIINTYNHLFKLNEIQANVITSCYEYLYNQNYKSSCTLENKSHSCEADNAAFSLSLLD